ncbi:hypothetical protein ANABIO32_02400 [Rossellomorea marisflavi]|uniref:hypothetical protein n=1 Tax=Rossellomorea marisflavi TaxID=189381 RepID=UPI0025CB07D8|nr:hypothetical protein [Rossellomorea marisflavi]GLI82553.1 hypothetical protein ANABIO32_02400 [Rossellomorea marisflavi]
MQVKCKWCKEKGEKEKMVCEETQTKNKNKNGTYKMIRKYFHADCHSSHLEDAEFKKRESDELKNLYDFLLELHGFKQLDARMLEKIQDLRNGSVKINGKKYKKYKEGVSYSLMLQTYQAIRSKLDYILRNQNLNNEWNQFSYLFGTMVKNINQVSSYNAKNKTAERKVNENKRTDIEVEVTKKRTVEKKDELDISEFL